MTTEQFKIINEIFKIDVYLATVSYSERVLHTSLQGIICGKATERT